MSRQKHYLKRTSPWLRPSRSSHFAASSKALGVALILCLGISTGCGKKTSPKNLQENELQSLRASLKSYDFKGETPKTLTTLDNLANRASGDTAVQAFYFAGRGYLDWFLTSLSSGDRGVFLSLLKALRVPPQCCKDRCLGKGRVSMTKSCQKKLFAALVKRFGTMAEKEGPSGAYVELSEEAKSLIKWLVYGLPTKDESLAESIHKLLATRDPMGTRARLALLFQLAPALEEISKRGRATASFVLARALPFACPGVFVRLLGAPSAKARAKILSSSPCGYACKDLQKATSPRQFSQVAVTKCDFGVLGYHRPKETKYHTIHASVAVRSLEALARVMKGVTESFADPIMKLHLSAVRPLLKRITQLHLPLPTPSAVKSTTGWISPPVHESPVKSASPKAPVVALVESSGISVFTPPLAGIHKKNQRILNEKQGIALPGKRFGPTPTDKKALPAYLKKARTLYTSVRPAKAKAKSSLWITLYGNGKEASSSFASWVPLFKKSGIVGLEIAFLSSHNPTEVPSAWLLSLEAPPKDAVHANEFLSKREKTKPPKDQKEKTPQIFTLSPQKDQTFDALVKTLSSIKKISPKARFFYKVK